MTFDSYRLEWDMTVMALTCDLIVGHCDSSGTSLPIPMPSTFFLPGTVTEFPLKLCLVLHPAELIAPPEIKCNLISMLFSEDIGIIWESTQILSALL